MSVETIVIAVLSGGLVGVVYKSGHERAERFRDRMYAAAERFLTTSDTAATALDQAARAGVAWREATREVNAALERVNAALEEFEVIDDGVGPASRLSALMTDLTAEIPGSAEGIREVLDELRREWHSTVEDQDVRDELDDSLNAYRKWVTYAEQALPTSHVARRSVSQAEAAGAQVALVFAGRRKGDQVVAAANRVIETLDRFRDLLGAAVDDPARFNVEGPAIWAEIEPAVADFAVAANSSARRLWL